jgi:protein-disulfide isomerase
MRDVAVFVLFITLFWVTGCGGHTDRSNDRFGAIEERLARLEVSVGKVDRLVTNMAGGFTGNGRPDLPVPGEPVPTADSTRMGTVSAPVAVVVFTDYHCPFCGAFARETLPRLRDAYVQSGKVALSVSNSPLDTLHPGASIAAAAATCAAAGGKFWEAHDLMFDSSFSLGQDFVSDIAHALGLDTEAFVGCINTTGIESVKQEVIRGRNYQIKGTPTIYVGRQARDGSVRVSKGFIGNVDYAVLAAGDCQSFCV